MTTIASDLARQVHEDIQAQADDVAAALRALKPNLQHRKHQMFALLYPVILEMLEKNVTQKAILELLGVKGLKMHPTQFKALMAVEAKLIAGGGAAEENAA